MSVIDPEVLRRVQALELKAKEVADGVLMGIHHAPHRGRSLEFAEHKEYYPGDDIRRIDWKKFGKSDRFYVKEFEDETNITAMLLLDRSRSMDYRSEESEKKGFPTKLEQGTTITAALSYLLLNQSDAVGMGLFGSGLSGVLPPRARQAHFHEITRRLVDLSPEEGTDIASALAQTAGTVKGRALILIVSDFLDDPDETIKAIKLLRGRRHEIALFHVLDPAEVEFPFERLSFFRDMEGPLRLLVDPRSIREEYKKHMSAYLARLRDECVGHGIDYWRAMTDEDPAKILTSWVAFRQAASQRTGGRR